MGDFNYDILSRKGAVLNKIFGNFEMDSKLELDDTTTKNYTQIDVIFANFSNISTGVYSSYRTTTNSNPVQPVIQQPIIHQHPAIQEPVVRQQLVVQQPTIVAPPVIQQRPVVVQPIVAPPIIPISNSQAQQIIQAAAPNRNDLYMEIIEPGRELDNFTIDVFIDTLVLRKFPGYTMQPIVFAQNTARYRATPNNRDDI